MELRDYLRGLRRHWIAVVLMTMVGVATAFGWVLLQTPVYEATANGLVQSKATAEQGGAVYGDSYAATKVPTYLEMVTWKVVAERAGEILQSDESPEELAARVNVVNPQGTSILKFTAQAGSPAEAATLAQAWIDALGETIDQVQSTSSDGGAPIGIYSAAAASVSNAPVFPDQRTAILVGGVLGLGVGIAFALVRTASDRRVRQADDVQARMGVPVVGTVPASAALASDHRLIDPSITSEKGGGFALSEAFRALRTNLKFMDVDNPPRTIVITSPLAGDGKSTIACNLSVALAANGEPVVLVDGDLRRPTVARTMALPGDAGLSDVLAGRVELADVLQRTATPNLFVLAAGSIPPNPSELLGSDRMRRVLDELATHAMVIIDAPPLLPVTDGVVLTHQADGALVTLSVGKTTYDVADKAIDALHKAQGRVLGVVLNKAPLKGVDSSAYSYEVRKGYVPDPSSPPSASASPESDVLGTIASSASAPTFEGRPQREATAATAGPDFAQESTLLTEEAAESGEVRFDDLVLDASEVTPSGRKRRARRN
ncbi:polysaccharide biosynthesis tyrosine autokinase [Microbacterium sp. ARD31]|uniref:polysaccharide biosynthesis tyrosine autokinase n=1 Tax=Microbacterium sp. ARD31 TaxID=2962576 RepID=UPI002882C0FA|nr:polysaccharide biosynthesis tyrosine autokinase [Microbacterium sp. ARD31]MDT0186468.1 polysaccharide biosynthesis tyrosine autokinase [Microbacterium sp. ARD31]